MTSDHAKNGPVIQAMRRWIAGEAVPSFEEQLSLFGIKYAHTLHAYRRGLRYDRGDLDGFMSVIAEREAFVTEFGFSVPNRDALAIMLACQPLLEIGAGSGHWARLLADRGADIIATDPVLERFSFRVGAYFPVERLAGKTAVRRWLDRNVFCSWPSLAETWLRQAARAMRPGRWLFVVREDATADERTWDYIEEAFESKGYCELLNWNMTHDRLEAWRKLGPKQARECR